MNQGDDVNQPPGGIPAGKESASGKAESQKSDPALQKGDSRAAGAKEHKVHQIDNVQQSGSRRWTDSLKQVYDPVLDEPIPDSIKDLLSKLDTDGKK